MLAYSGGSVSYRLQTTNLEIITIPNIEYRGHVTLPATRLRVVYVETEHTGGGVVATLHTLSDGRILIGSNTDETIQIAENLKAWRSGDYDENIAYINITTALWKLGI